MKQTAVEWLGKELESYGDPQFCKIEWEQLDSLIQQAKEMEKEQTLDFTRNAVRKILDEDRQNPFNLEQYYNKTYGGAE